MIFKRIKSEGVAHNSYLIGSENDAAVIDPRRDCQVYIDLARQKGLKIKYIFETHRNEDYAIGSIELNYFTGAKIYHGSGLDWKYGNTLKDGQVFQISKFRLTAIHTPGHTDESMSYAVADLSTGEANVLVFTGDALFVGEVGRTDLYGPEESTRLAANLYDSIVNKLLPLGDGVILCPAHGAGSVCGANIADRDESTLGLEKIQNPLLHVNRDEFIKYKVAEKLERPHYFRQMEKYNLEGPPLLGCLPLLAPLTPAEFKQEMERGAVVVDTRYPAAFGGAHIKGAYSIWLAGLQLVVHWKQLGLPWAYSIWLAGLPVFAGWALYYDKPILLVLEEPHHLEQAVRYLIRIGYDRIVGYLKGGIEGWYNAEFPVEHLQVLTVYELQAKLNRREKLTLLDVRSEREWNEGHIKGALHIYVGHIKERMADIPKDKPVAMFCNVGHRAGLGASILLQEGYREVYNVLGGMTAWKAAGYPISAG